MSKTHFSIGGAELKKVITQISPMFKGGFDVPTILFNVEDKITISSTNGDAYTKIIFDCEDIQEKGSFVVQGDIFESVIKQASPSDKIEIIEESDDRLSILIGRFKYQTSLLEKHEGAFFAPEFDKANSFTLGAQDLKTAISAVSGCIDQAKAHLNCVMMHTDAKKEGKIFIVATDGMRLGVAERDCKANVAVPNLMIPKKSAEFILSMLGEMQGDITISFTDNMIQLSTGSIDYTSKLLDTAFPKYQSVVPTDEANNKILDVKVKDLQDALKKTFAMAKITFRIKMAIKKDSIELSCDDNGTIANGSVDATFTEGEQLDIVCNYRLLMEILDKIDNTDVRFQFADSNTPILIRAVGDDSVKYVFMPFVS